MNKRLLVVLLFIASVISIVLVLWFFLFRKPVTTPVVRQPDQQVVTPSRPFDPSSSTPTYTTPTTQAVDPQSPAELERQAQDRLKKAATNITTRLGTFAADDGFEAIRESQLIATVEFSKKLSEFRTTQQATHAVGSRWFQEFTPITATIDPGSLPARDRQQATVVVQGKRTLPSSQDFLTVTLKLVLNNQQWFVEDATFQTIQ